MGEFYGLNLFLAKSSATTGGLDSLLEPTGNIKKAQEMAARAFDANHVFFVTNGTSTSNKMAVQALLAPGDIAIVDRNCHKSHHYGMVLAGAQPLYAAETFPMTEYSMSARCRCALKQALLNPEGRWQARSRQDAGPDQLHIRRSHLQHTSRNGGMSGNQADLIFLWDEPSSGFTRFSPFLRPRTAMGAASDIDLSKSVCRIRKQRTELGEQPRPDEMLLDTHLIPDPRKVKLQRSIKRNSTHKSMSAAWGSMLLVKDVEFRSVEAQFHEAVFTHATSQTSN